MKVYRGVEVWLHTHLTSALDTGESQLYTTVALHPREEAWYSMAWRVDGPGLTPEKRETSLALTGNGTQILWLSSL
jgi:hypothetical protein